MTIAELQKKFIDKLITIYDSREARAISKLVFEKTLELNPLQLSLEKFRLITDWQADQLNEILNRLLKHEPVQYVLGETDFFGLRFTVSKDVLIPRPETEELVEWILDDLAASETFGNPEKALKILDIGTGSGCIAIALARHLPDSIIEGLDISEAALSVAKQNNELNETRVLFFPLDILSNNLSSAGYDVIVSNPPYIPSHEADSLAANVVNYEPHTALFTPNNDPLIFYHKIASEASTALLKGGKLFFEIHASKGEEVHALLKSAGYTDIQIKHDLSGKQRMIQATKPR